MADFNKIIPLIKQWEGGLSKDTSDTASKFPVPDGSGNHTNKGVTWQTFSTNAKKLGYQPTIDNFYKMPDAIWLPLFKIIFWDYYIKGDKIKSLSIALFLVDWAWGSGNWSVKNLQQVLNRSFKAGLKVTGVMDSHTLNITNSIDQKKLLDLLKAERIDFYDQIIKNNPSQKKFEKGWKDRTTSVFDFVVKNFPPTAAVVTGGFFLSWLEYLQPFIY